MSSPGKKCALAAAVVSLWMLTVGVGVRSLFLYSNTPGEPGTPTPRWPIGTGIRPAPGRATLVVLVHPQCPCSEATIGELARIMAHAQQKVDAYVLFYAPRQESSGWVKAGLWRSATAIPGVRALEDYEGGEARRFHAATSGQTLLYDAGGQLVFSGGITARRGHAGDNDGREAIVSALLEGVAPRRTTPVFGCSLLGEAP